MRVRLPSRPHRVRRKADDVIRIGFYGLLGSGNFGNDGSFEAVLRYLRAEYPDATMECLCTGPDEIERRYGVPARRVNWNRREYQTVASPGALAVKALGKLVDAVRIPLWVRRFDVVIVPGSGILESSLAVRPWDRPYALFLVCLAGRLVGTTVALVGVGANVSGQPATRWLLNAAVRAARYRSFRDVESRASVSAATTDPVYPDLAFALPPPAGRSGQEKTVGVGVMTYHGGAEDRHRADELYARYVERMRELVSLLLDSEYRVVLFRGDDADTMAVTDITSAVLAERPAADRVRVEVATATSLTEVMRQMAPADVVVATRYHNVLCALKMGKPTVSIGYATKNDTLMADMGMPEYCHSIRDFDVALVRKQVGELERDRDVCHRLLASANRATTRRLGEQFADLRRLPAPGVPRERADRSRENMAVTQYRSVEAAEAYLQSHDGPATQARFLRARMALVARELAAVPGGRLVDVGCGPGMMVRELLSARSGDFDVTAIDRSPGMVSMCANRLAGFASARVLAGRVEALPLPDAGTDVVLAMGVLEYADTQAALSEIARVLRPGGLSLVTMLNPLSLYRTVEWYLHDPLLRLARSGDTPPQLLGPGANGMRPRREAVLRRAVVRAGLRVQRTVYFDPVLLVRRWTPSSGLLDRSLRHAAVRPWLGSAYLMVVAKPNGNGEKIRQTG